MCSSREEAYAYHRRVVSQLSESQREAYEYLLKCGDGRMANDIARDLDINPLTAGTLMHHLAAHGLVHIVGEGRTSHGHTANRYIACHPLDMRRPLPRAVKQTPEQKLTALGQEAHILQYFIDNHPDARRLVDLRNKRMPEYAEMLTKMHNDLVSATAAMKKKAEKKRRH